MRQKEWKKITSSKHRRNYFSNILEGMGFKSAWHVDDDVFAYEWFDPSSKERLYISFDDSAELEIYHKENTILDSVGLNSHKFQNNMVNFTNMLHKFFCNYI